MGRGKSKKPKSAYKPTETKSPRASVDPTSHNRSKPTWRFRIVDTGGPWCWTAMDEATAKRVLERLRAFETMVWRDILGSENHAIPIANLARAARDRLVELKQDDAEELVSLRVTGKERVFGIRDGATLQLLWWDAQHEICPSVKKHT